MWQGMCEEANERLEQLGVDTTGCEALTEAECLRAYNYVTGICNLEFVPEVLKPVCIDMACAGVITARGADGSLALNEAGRLKSIKEGDVTLEFFENDSAALAQRLIDGLDMNDKSLLISYRRLKW